MNQKFNKGITLIALVITIIVLLILAGVTINMVLGDDGIIKQATDAGKAQKEAEEKQAIQIATGEAKTSEYMGTMTEDEVEAKFDNPNMFDNVEGNNIPAYNNSIREVKVFGEGEDAKYLPIPKGMAWAFGEVDEGAVVVDSYGNEFVWVPVDGINVTISDDSEVGSDETMQKEEKAMKTSVNLYKGFYVGRYETSYNGTRVASVGNVAPLYQTQEIDGTAETNWNTFYTKQKELHANSDSIVSGMIYDGQWDAIMDWMSGVKNPNALEGEEEDYIYNSRGMGNYGTGSPILTGSNSEYKVKNIFDLAGNYFEWTQRAVNIFDRGLRGGCVGNGGDVPASYSGGNVPDFAFDGFSSRLQLYINVEL